MFPAGTVELSVAIGHHDLRAPPRRRRPRASYGARHLARSGVPADSPPPRLRVERRRRPEGGNAGTGPEGPIGDALQPSPPRYASTDWNRNSVRMSQGARDVEATRTPGSDRLPGGRGHESPGPVRENGHGAGPRLATMVRTGLRHLAVVDGTFTCVGVVGDRAVAAAWAADPSALAWMTVGHILDSRPSVVGADATHRRRR